MPDPALGCLLNRIRAIRDEAVKQQARYDAGLPRRDFDVGWQLGRFVDEFEQVLGQPSSDLAALINPPAPTARKEP